MKTIAGVAALVVGVFAVAAAQTPPSLFADRTFSGGVGRINDLTFSPDGRLLAVVGSSGGVAVWDVQTGSPIRQVTGTGEATVRVAFGVPGNVVAIGENRGAVSVLDLRSGQAIAVARHSRAVTSLAIAPDGLVGASGDGSGDLLIWPSAGGSAAERLREDTSKDAIVFLAFTAPTTLVSITSNLRIVTWDVSKKRSLRKGTVQLESIGRQAEFSAASADPAVTQLALASQYLNAPRGGVLAGQSGLARPEDTRRTNVIVPYALESGIAGDAIQLGDFLAERLSLSPGSCYALFSSNYRDQPRLHVWSMVKQGQDLVSFNLPARPAAVVLDPTGRYLAAGFPNGEVRTWRASGTSASDCSAFRTSQSPPPSTMSARVTAGSESTPLFSQGSGFRVAVLGFEVGGVEPYLGDAVGEMVSGGLSNSPSVVVVERAAINKVVTEMQLQRSGLTAADAARIGRGLNVEKVVLGRVSRLGETSFLLQARVVDVETSQVQGSRDITCANCKEQDLPLAVNALRRLIVP